MIEDKVRGLVAEVMAAGSSRTLKQQVDDIAELDHAVGMLQAALNARTASFLAARRREDLAMGGSLDTAGRGAPVEIALARRVSTAAVDHQLAFAEPLTACHPRLLRRVWTRRSPRLRRSTSSRRPRASTPSSGRRSTVSSRSWRCG